jgi:16S rRNA (guanine527-N7)-methyltransferase
VFRELLRQHLQGIVSLSPEQLFTLESHYKLLSRWNQVLNLTTIKSLAEAVERHYCESLFLAAHLRSGSMEVADIGSGAGFPGIPVAVLRPDCSVTLIESHRRKAVFLREATRKFPNVRVLGVRAQEVNEAFDCAVSRGVSYEDLVPVLTKLARTADLLTGGEEPPAELEFAWDDPVRMPWGKSRFLRRGINKVLFHVEHQQERFT